MAKSIRVVSMVCAEARKCHARCPKKGRCSTTAVSIFAALTAYFENKTRYSRFSPARNGTLATGTAGAAGVLGRALARLGFWARMMDEHAAMIAGVAALLSHRAFIEFM